MKNLIATATLVALSMTAFGQSKYGANATDSVTCVESLSLLQEFSKQKNYDEAYNYWKTAFSTCPAASKNIYIYGVKIFRHRIKNAADDAAKQNAIDTLMMVYDNRITHFGQECFVNGRKGIEMQRYMKDDKEGIYNTLKSAIDGCGDKSEAPVMSSYYMALYQMYKIEKADKEMLLTEYVRMQKLLDGALVRNCEKGTEKLDKRCKQYKAAGEKMNEVFFRVAECPEIEGIVTKMIEEKPGDIEVCKGALKVLDKKGCDESDIYRQVAECVHNDTPTHESAYSLGKIYAKKKNFGEAFNYMKQAVELCADCPDQEKYLEKAGQTASALGRISQVNEYAGKLLEKNPNNGEAYILKAGAIAAKIGKCDDQKQNWCAAWRAYDMYAKAKSVDSSVSAKAQERMNRCRASWPESKDMFFEGLTEGQEVQCTCVGGSTKARAK